MLLLAIYGGIAGVMALEAFGLLRRLKKNPSFATVFIWCVIALLLLSMLSTNIRMLMAIKREGYDRREKAVEARLNSRAKPPR